jgi:quercetin dioxygenase-like cupin family protein
MYFRARRFGACTKPGFGQQDALCRFLPAARIVWHRLAPMATPIPLEDLQFSPTAALFQGRDDIDVSIFVTQYERGQGVDLHVHPYAEVFVVVDGTAEFTVGDEQVTVPAGNMIMAPPETPHRFEGAGDDTLRVVSVHPSGEVQQTWL